MQRRQIAILIGIVGGCTAFVAAADRIGYRERPAGGQDDAWLSRHTSFGPRRDVDIAAPPGGWGRPLRVQGGRHVRIDGRNELIGRIVLRQQTGSIRIANARIFMTDVGDAIAVASRNGHAPDVTLENIVVGGVRGTRAGVHSDIFQGQGDIGRLTITDLTGSSGYQGIFLKGTRGRAVGSVHLKRVALSHSGAALGFLLWFGDGVRKPGDVASPRFPVYLDEVYVTPRPGEDLGRSIYPNKGITDAQGRDIGAYSTDGGRTWRWPPAANIHGVVIAGPPPARFYRQGKGGGQD